MNTHILILGSWSEILEKAFLYFDEVSYFVNIQSSSFFNIDLLKKCKNVVQVDIQQIGICLAMAIKLHKQNPFTGVISFNEIGIESASIIACTLQIKGIELWPTVITKYKNKMREILTNYPNLYIPWKIISNNDQLNNFYKNYGPKIIMKPISGTANIGVIQIKNEQELQLISKKLNWTKIGKQQVEKFIGNQEMFSVETLSISGKHIIITMSQTKIIGYPYTLVAETIIPPTNIIKNNLLKF